METISYGEVPPGTAVTAAQGSGHLLSGTYLLEREIGRGGMGEVYLATHARLPGRFAVKLLLPELAENREAFARFCREAEIMSELRHPNIVQIFDFNIAPDERPYFVMEYLEGRDLEARLGGRRRCRWRRSSASSTPWRRRWPPRTRTASSTATSSRRTSSWRRSTARPTSW